MATLNYLTTTHFDFGALGQLAGELKRLGITKPLIATDTGIRATGILDKVVASLGGGDAPPVFDGTPPNPTEAAVLDALALYQSSGADGLIALGGGSSMDLAKAVALLANSGGPLEKYDPAKGGGRFVQTVAPLVAIPTTAGTGSEVSVGFVIILNDGRKATFASPKFLPLVAICDPELTLGLPPLLTAATGMDAITHCIEAVLSPVVNPPAEGVGLDGLWRGWRHIKRAVADGQDRDARWHMMMASTEGAMAFVKGLGAVHSMSHACGRRSELKLHHGTLNAVILPAILRFNAAMCEEKYVRLRQAMGLQPDADLAEAVEEMNAAIGLPADLKSMGVKAEWMDDLVHHALHDLATRSNPRPVSADDYRLLFTALL